MAPVGPRLSSHHLRRRFIAADEPLERAAEEEVLARQGARRVLVVWAGGLRRAAARAECTGGSEECEECQEGTSPREADHPSRVTLSVRPRKAADASARSSSTQRL